MSLFRFVKFRPQHGKSSQLQRRKPALTRCRPTLEELESRFLMTSGLVAAYNFAQGSGSVLTDVSGNGNNGTLTDTAWVKSNSSTLPFASALYVCGKTNSMATIPDSASLNLTTGMTLEAWVNPSSLNSTGQGLAAVIGKDSPSTSNGLSYALYAANGTGTPPAVNILDNGTNTGLQAPTQLSLNTWTFLAATYDGSTLKMYVNGNLVSSQSLSGSITTTSNALRLGGDAFGQMFTGEIANVRIYNTALSQSAIQTDMNTPILSATDSAPTVTAVTPANNATGVSTSSAITVQFSKALDPGTVTSSTIQLLNSSGKAVAASVSYNSSTYTATLTPSAALSNSSRYTVLVHGGTSGYVVLDSLGTPLAANFSSTFTMTSGLVAAYNFAQGSGSVLTDVSGNGNNGTLTDTAWVKSNSSTLPFASALYVNGKTNSMATIPDSASLNLTTGMTLEAWVNPSSLNGTGQGLAAVIGKDNSNSSSPISYALYAANGTNAPPAGQILDGGTSESVQGQSQLSLNTWTFLAATYDGSSLKMYVNGNLVSSQSLSGNITTTSNALRLGGDAFGQMFTGEIANVRIYNTALSQSAIQTDMNTPILSATDSAPTVTAVTPANNATGVSTSSAITVQFSEALDPGTVTSSTIQLLNSSGKAVAASVSYNSSTYTATLTPSAALSNSSRYTVLVHGGTSGYVVLDSLGTPLAANFSSTFTTAAASPAFPNNQPAPPLPPPSGTVINVSTVNQLQSAVANLQSGQTIMIAPGTYKLTGTLYVPQGLTNVAIRGATGKAGDVVIQGDAVLDSSSPYNGSDTWGSGSGVSGSILFGIWLGNVQGVTVADLTLKDYVDDAIELNAGVQSPLIHNVVMLDTGEQLLKSNPNGSGGGVNNGVVEYCTIGYTSLAPNNYTNGIDLHTTQNWIIRNNLFQNIATTNPLTTASSGAIAGPSILVWNGSKNCTVENNTFINCQREIAFGLSDPSTITDDNTGGIIENNFIYRSGTQHGDVAIGVWNSPNTEVAYNTIILNGDYVNAIEYRFSTTTGVKILYNLTDSAITQRDSASATVTGNVTSGVQSSWFVNEAIGNLNLTTAATGAIGKGQYLSEVSTDYNGLPRPSNGPTDVGASEYVAGTDTPPMVILVTPANNASNVSTSTPITVQFSEALDPTTVTSSTIQLLNSSGSALAASVSYNSSTDTATLTPSAALANSSTYTIVVHGGTSGAVVKDAADNPLVVNFSSSFTTAAAVDTPPTVTSVTPANNASTVSTGTAITVQFSKALDPTTVTNSTIQLLNSSGTAVAASVTYNASTYTATLTPSSALATSSAYTLLVHGGTNGAVIKDAADTPLSTNYSSTFTTDAPLTASAGSTESGKEGTAVQFSGSASGGTGGTTYSWNFGDSSTATGTLTPSHTYSTAGTYTVTLTVTDSSNERVTTSTTATIVDVPPTANPAGPYTGTTGTAITFSGSASDPDPKDTLAYAWNFGDGSTSTQLSPTHTYTTAGTYNVTFTVTASDGAQTSTTTTAAVSSSLIQPVTTAYITTPYLSIPNFGAKPTIYSVKSGNWSDPTIWSLGRTPQAGDIVDINPGTTITYNVNDATDAIPLNTLEIQPTATLTFATNVNTQICVGNFLVLQGGSLIVGTAANPIAANVHANIDIANQAINTTLDPNQFGTGLIGLGNVTMHGAALVPYATLAQEPHAGDTDLHFATPVTGWQVGQDILLPDTRQLPYLYENYTYTSEQENVVIQSISADGLTVTLTAPLKYDHLGAHDANGVLNYLPQVMNTNRNIMVESQSFTGTRGYTLFTDRANVDIEYAGFCELGRTNITDILPDYAANGILTYNIPGTSYFNSSMPINFPDRTAMTMLDLIGPTTPQADGYQFTLIGNEVDNDGDGNANNPSNIQWGIVLNNSSYGLIQNNDVYSVAGAGIGVEDGASSYNRFDGNFVANVVGDGSRVDRSFQGDAFWFGNPNNYITNNIATDINGAIKSAWGYGFDIDASSAGTVKIPISQGADPSVSGQSKSINMNDTPILAFSGNEVYGATADGMTLWWIGTVGDGYYTDAQTSVIKNFVAWNFSHFAFYGYPTNNVTIDGMVVRGDASQLNNGNNPVTGIVFDDYMTHDLVVENSDIQGMGTGIYAPYMVGRTGTMDTTVIENSYLDNTVDILIAPPRSTNGASGLSPQTLDITSVQFSHPSAAPQSWWYDVSMDYITSDAQGTSNMSIPQYVYVTNYNDVQGDNFQVFYTQSPSPTGTVPAGATTKQYINGYVEPT